MYEFDDWRRDGQQTAKYKFCAYNHDHNPRSDKEDEQNIIRIAQLFGFTVAIGHAADGAHRGGHMVMLSEREIQLKQTLEEGSITRVSLEWQGREYEIASIYELRYRIYTRNDNSKRLIFFSHLAQRLTKHTIAGGNWNCTVWSTATTVLIESSKVSGIGGTRRDLWHIPSEPRVAASKPRLCTCLLICFHEVFGEGNFCDFCNADASDECECAGEYRGPSAKPAVLRRVRRL